MTKVYESNIHQINYIEIVDVYYKSWRDDVPLQDLPQIFYNDNIIQIWHFFKKEIYFKTMKKGWVIPLKLSKT